MTFADLMGLLLSFFVMLVAFSQPKTKEQGMEVTFHGRSFLTGMVLMRRV